MILLILAIALVLPVVVEAQVDTVTIVAGSRYEAGDLKQKLLGRDYRQIWTTPMRVPVLDLETFAGGLTAVERGGGQQTRSIRFRGEDGFEYNFRSLDKEITQGIWPDLKETVVDDLIQDQVSSMHPAAAIVTTAFVDAVGLLHPGPRLYVMPDDPRLGEYQEEFGGMLGTIEAHANESEDGERVFAGADQIESDEDFFVRLRESAENRVDARAFLTSRLLSMFLGDWDRHEGQFRWARYDSADIRTWVPIPEDRDFAFSDYDGVLLKIANMALAEAAEFGTDYDLRRLAQNSAQMDRRLLTGLEWSEWHSIVNLLEAQLTDELIESSVRTMPAEYFSGSGPELIRILIGRRSGLQDIARQYYLQLARDAEIHTTEEDESAEVTRRPNGDVHVKVVVSGEEADESPVYFERTFHPLETDEIRLHLYGGDDEATVRGAGPGGTVIRVIGGDGDDVLVDSSSVSAPGVHTVFYDANGENEIDGTLATAVDRTPFEGPEWIPELQMPVRDWGTIHSMFMPWAGYEGTEGLIVGGGPQWTWYGFRQIPYTSRIRLRGMYGFGSGEIGLDATADFVNVGSRASLLLHGRASGLEAVRFHGFGNNSSSEVGGVVRYDQILAEALFGFAISPELSLATGPVFEHIDVDESPGQYGKIGLRSRLAMDTRADTIIGGGARLAVNGDYFPEAWDLDQPFGRVGAEVATYSPLPGPALLALRAGGSHIFGSPQFTDAIYLGGSENLRGFQFQRFVGDGALYGGAEMRAKITRAELLVHGDLGVLAFTDAGRVFVDGRSEGDWHTSVGGGIWFATLQRLVSLTYARGEEEGIFYLHLGFPF